MRILIYSWEFPPNIIGGLGKHLAQLAPALGGLPTQYGPITVDIVTTRLSGGLEIERISEYATVHRVDTPPLDALDLYNSVIANNDSLVEYGRSLTASYTFDAIHIHDWLPGVAGVTLKYENRLPLVTTVHATERGRHQGYLSSHTSQQIDSLEWQICHEAWKVIVCSDFMTSELNYFFRTPFDKIEVIPNGIAMDKLHYCSEKVRSILREKYAPNGERLLFSVGRIVHEKGAHVLIQAMPTILKEFPNTRLLIAGKNSRRLWRQAHELGVDQAISFLDFISNQKRDQLYQVVDAAVFPSLYEPFGIVALEAMALGCNVIASDVGGLGEVVHHLQNGLTIYPNNPDSIAWAVRHLFSDPVAAQRQRELAIERVRQIYDWNSIAEQTAKVFEDVVTERRQTDW